MMVTDGLNGRTFFMAMRKIIGLAILASLLAFCDGPSKKDKGPQKSEVEQKVEGVTLAEINSKIRKDINNADLYHQRGVIHMNSGDLVSALEDLNRALGLQPQNDEFFLTKAKIHFKQKQYRDAEIALAYAIRYDESNVEAMIKMSELMYFSGRFDESMKFLDQALRVDKYNADAYFMKGLNFIQKSDTSLAISSWQTAIEQDPDFYNAYYELGGIYALRKDKLAIQYYDNAIRIRPDHLDAYYNKGLFCQENDELNLALETYTKIVELDPNYKNAYYNMGYINMYYLRMYRQAAQHFSDAIRVDPQFYQAYYNRGYSFELMGDVIKARVDYENALKIKPNYGRALEGMDRVRN